MSSVGREVEKSDQKARLGEKAEEVKEKEKEKEVPGEDSKNQRVITYEELKSQEEKSPEEIKRNKALMRQSAKDD